MSDTEIIPGGPALPASTYKVVARANMPIGTPVYADADETGTIAGCAPARANTLTTSGLLGLLTEPGVTGENVNFRSAGPVNLTAAQWTAVLDTGSSLNAGSIYYVSAASAGKITLSVPVASGSFPIVVGIALTETALFLSRSISPVAHT